MNSNSKNLFPVLLAVAFIAGFATDRLWESADRSPKLEQIAVPAAQNYVCPMHAHIHSHEQGQCPVCGMDLVLARDAGHTDGSNDDEFPVVSISSGVVNNLGVRTTRVKRGTLPRKIDTMGLIGQISTARNTDIKPGIPGRLEFMTTKEVGEIVQVGEVMYSVFSPERIRAQEEYLASWQAKDYALLPKLWDALRKFHFSDVEIKKPTQGEAWQSSQPGIPCFHPGGLLQS